MQQNIIISKNLLIIFFTIFLVSGCALDREEEKISDVDTVLDAVAQQEVATEEKQKEVMNDGVIDDETLLYKNEELGIEFKYPEKWGLFEDKKGSLYNGFETLQVLFVSKQGSDFLTGSRFIVPPENVDEKFFGGNYSQERIDMICERNSNLESCELKTNEAGIRYAKISGMSMVHDNNFTEAEYHFFNPDSKFGDITFSTVGLDLNTGKAVENGVTEKELDSIMKSLRFSKN